MAEDGGRIKLADAYVQIIPVASGIKGKIAAELGAEADTAGESAGATAGGKLVSGIKKAIAAAGIGMAIKQAITEGADLEQSIGGIETLFKDSSSTVIENAKQAYKTAGLSANEYMENVTSFSASLLSSLGGNTDEAARVADMAMVDMSDNANKMGTSMESIQNAYQGFAKQNYTMLDNLKLGYGGTKEEMQRLLKDAQKISGVEYKLDNLNDVYEAIHVIQGELDITGTTAKEAATTLSGSLSSMKAAATNVLGNLALGEDIGPPLMALQETVHTFIDNNLVPMLSNVISALPAALQGISTLIVTELNVASNHAEEIINFGIEFVKNLVVGILTEVPYLIDAAIGLIASFATALINTDWSTVCTDFINLLKENLDIAAGEILGTDGNIVASVINAINNKLPDVLNKGVEVISNVANGILQSLPVVLQAIGSIINELLNFIFDNLPQLLASGVKLIEQLANGMTQNVPAVINSIMNIVNNILNILFNRLPDLLNGGIELIGQLAKGMLDKLPTVTNSIMDIINNILDTLFKHLPDFLNSGVELIGKLAQGLIDNLPTVVNSITNIIKELLNTLLEHLPDFLNMGIELIGKLAAGLISAIPDVLSAVPQIIGSIIGVFTDTDWGDVGLNIIGGIASGVRSAAGQLIGAIKDVASSALEGVKGFLGIHSPSRVFEQDVGKMIDLGLAAGIENNVLPVTDAMQELGKSTVGTINTDFNITPITNNTIPYQYDNISQTEINFNGNYKFNDEKDIDYFLNKAALRLAVSR